MSRTYICKDRRSDARSTSGPDRRSGRDRRSERRIGLSLETAVPVVVRYGGLVQWGLARNVSEGGMLVEVREAPPIGSQVEIKLSGVEGSITAPEPAILRATVRHHVAWQFCDKGAIASMTGVGVRYEREPMRPAPTEPISDLPTVVH